MASWRRMTAALLVAISMPAQGAALPAGAPTIGARLAAQLAAHPLIALGEHHASAPFHRLLQALLRDPQFICHLDDVVLESGNSGLQSIADRYVSGRSVPREEKVRMWRDTTQWLVWDSPVYERIFDTVREINMARLCPRPLRILLGDPAIPWAQIHSAAEYRNYGERDQSYADVVEREVVARHHRALLVSGQLHIQKRGPAELSGARPSYASIVEGRHPGMLISILTTGDPAIAARAGIGPDRPLAMIRGTPFGAQSFVQFAPAASARVVVNGETVWRPLDQFTWPAVQDVVDGVLYLSGDNDFVPADPAIYREPAYQAELRRRAPILKDVYGVDFLPELEALIAGPSPSPH